MIRIDNLKLPPGAENADLVREAARLLHVKEKEILTLQVLRRSIDARKEVQLVYSLRLKVKDEQRVLGRWLPKNVMPEKRELGYVLPVPQAAPAGPPVVVGAGPAGLFAALVLARAGLKPILLERGRSVGQRREDVERFWRTGVLDPASNVQFGEGGAGAFPTASSIPAPGTSATASFWSSWCSTARRRRS